jgi:hypothetical protein
MKKDAMGVTCCMYGINEKSVQNFVGKPEEKTPLKSPRQIQGAQ